MKWWKKLIFSIISLLFGYVSLDCLYYAFTKLTDAGGDAKYYDAKGGLLQLLGAAIFIAWFFLVALYLWLIRKSSPQIDVVERDRKTGKQRIRRKWFDTLFQVAFIITGMIIRCGYVIYIYIPKQ